MPSGPEVAPTLPQGGPNPAEGLTSAEAARRLAQYGPNSTKERETSGAKLAFRALFGNPLAIVLLVAAAVSGALGDLVNASIIVVLVGFSVGLESVQTHRSRVAMQKLQGLVAPQATVRRDGQWAKIPRENVVPGDVARLAAGDLVPADGSLIEEKDLHVQESALTGESMPAEKEVGATDDKSRVFLGTSVVSGTATMLAEKTGAATMLGGIAAHLATKAPPTEFERGLRAFGSFITRVVIILVGVTLAAMLGFHRPALPSLLFAVALAVGLTPEFLPMITTLTLSRGAVRMARHGVIVKNLASIQNFGSMDVLCSDKTGTITVGKMTLERSFDPAGNESDEPRKWGALNSEFQSGIDSPLDAAILAVVKPEDGWTKVDEIPFDFERRRLSVVVEREGRRILITKGSPDGVLPLCGSKDAAGNSAADLTVSARLGAEGYRVLAVGTREVETKASYGVADEAGLTPVGFLAFVDPPLPNALDVIHRLKASGVDLKIITGDDPAVTAHVCAEVGIKDAVIVLGSEVEKMNDDALQSVAERTLVFARMSPAQKNRVLLALKARGHVVGYMGDGINDAPSLHTADVGISFAEAADVARDAAQIILTERNLGLLLKAVLEGRMAFGNVMKYLLMGTSSNFGNVFSMAGSALFLPFLPMLPTQILLNNLLYDLAQVTIPTDRVDSSYIRKPKRWDIGLIRRFMLWAGPVSSVFDVVTFVVLLRVFHAAPAEFRTGWFVESLATQTLVIFVVRTQGLPWRSRPSRSLVALALAVVVVGGVLPYTPIARFLGFVPLPAAFFGFLAVTALAYLAAVEAVKRKAFGPASIRRA